MDLTKEKDMNIIKALKKWRAYRNTVNELSVLSNRDLNDLGISRGEISSLARKSVY